MSDEEMNWMKTQFRIEWLRTYQGDHTWYLATYRGKEQIFPTLDQAKNALRNIKRAEKNTLYPRPDENWRIVQHVSTYTVVS